jgi:hypothetical protein
MTKREPWYIRLVRSMGLDPYSKNPRAIQKSQDVIKGTSKHARAMSKPADWREKRRARRRIAKQSRRINRKA